MYTYDITAETPPETPVYDITITGQAYLEATLPADHDAIAARIAHDIGGTCTWDTDRDDILFDYEGTIPEIEDELHGMDVMENVLHDIDARLIPSGMAVRF